MQPSFAGMQPGGDMKERYERSKSVFAPGKRVRLNILSICVVTFLPWFLFTALFALVSFGFHYTHPTAVWVIYSLGLIVPLGSAGLMCVEKQRNSQFPMWYTFATAAFLLAFISAGVVGDLNFWSNMEPFYDMQTMNTYAAVNPGTTLGQEMMDAGRAYFSSGTHLDLKKAMGFKNHDYYCVAPIVNTEGSAKHDSYDFWAVGTNCCNGQTNSFRCGEFNNPFARSGLRLLRDDERPFYRLAVQQAESAYNIKAMHPIFFHWMQDPVNEVNSYRDTGFKWLLMGSLTHFGFNLFCVTCAAIAFAKVGRGFQQ